MNNELNASSYFDRGPYQKAEQPNNALIGNSDHEGGAGVGEGPVLGPGGGGRTVQAARAGERGLGAGRSQLGQLQARRGLGRGGEALRDLHEAVGRHLIFKQKGLSPLLGKCPLSRRSAP